MNKLKDVLPSLAVAALLIASGGPLVAQTESAIFPTPWQVVAGACELAQDGTLVGAHRRVAVPRRHRLRAGVRWSPFRSACGWAG